MLYKTIKGDKMETITVIKLILSALIVLIGAIVVFSAKYSKHENKIAIATIAITAMAIIAVDIQQIF